MLGNTAATRSLSEQAWKWQRLAFPDNPHLTLRRSYHGLGRRHMCKNTFDTNLGRCRAR